VAVRRIAGALGGCVVAVVLAGAGVSLFLFPGVDWWGSRTRFAVSHTIRGCADVRVVAEYWRSVDRSERCPSLGDLVDAHLLRREATTDWWGTTFVVHCQPDGDIHVVSAGRDRLLGTEDDLRDDLRPEELRRLKRLYRPWMPTWLW
jgi:hypothetical protein